MVTMKDLSVTLLIDKYSASPVLNIGEISAPKQMGEYEIHREYPISVLHKRNDEINRPCQSYRFLAVYFHKRNEYRATLCFKRKRNHYHVPSYFVSFESSHQHPLEYFDVNEAIQDLRRSFKSDLRTSEVHLASDFKNPRNIELNKRICLRIKPGKMQTKNVIETSFYFGAVGSPKRITVYDKAEQLLVKNGVDIDEDTSRVELRIKMKGRDNKLNIKNIEEAGYFDWSIIYNKQFSFHYPNKKLIAKIGNQAKWMDIWELRDCLKERYGITSSNFYRDYLKEHHWLSSIHKTALKEFRWNPYTKQESKS